MKNSNLTDFFTSFANDFPNIIIVGAQFGDEGKGKIIDEMSAYYDIIVRFNGGHNAGHTIVVNDKKYKLSIIPSGIIREKICFIGAGVVIDPNKLQQELKMLNDNDVNTKNKIYIADNATIILDVYKKYDQLYEMSKGKNKIGTTGNGIGPTYADKVNRNAFRVCDLNDNENAIKEKIAIIVNNYNSLLKGYKLNNEQNEQYQNLEYINESDVFQEIKKYHEILKPYAVNSYDFFYNQNNIGKKILFEGAQGLLLDRDHGTYPYVTSSSTFSTSAFTGSGIYNKNTKVIGVCKAYVTRVGNGVLITEQNNEIGQELQQTGQEKGTVTGRIRRCGWLDLVSTKVMIKENGIEDIIITKLDILNNFENIKVCVAYKIDNKEYNYPPSKSFEQEKIEPIYKEFKGWKKDISNIKVYEDLPQEAKEYLNFIEQFLETKILLFSNGPSRGQIFSVPQKETTKINFVDMEEIQEKQKDLSFNAV